MVSWNSKPEAHSKATLKCYMKLFAVLDDPHHCSPSLMWPVKSYSFLSPGVQSPPHTSSVLLASATLIFPKHLFYHVSICGRYLQWFSLPGDKSRAQDPQGRTERRSSLNAYDQQGSVLGVLHAPSFGKHFIISMLRIMNLRPRRVK